MSAPGTGFAVLVNANARRGGRRIAAQIGTVLRGANVRLTRSLAEIENWLRVLPDPKMILSAGGDGTAIALLTALSHVRADHEVFPPIGLLPLGTGNGWARATGAPKIGESLRLLARGPAPLPTRAFGLVAVEDTLCQFAGCGWDGLILNDYREQLAATKNAGVLSKTVYGYLSAIFTRSLPKSLTSKRPRVVIENLGEEVFTVNAGGRPTRLAGAKRGTVLYEGTFGVTGVATTPEFGYGFRAFPFAERMLGLVNCRLYAGHPFTAITNLRQLWHGHHPMPHMFDWFSTGIRMHFSQPVPLEIGGDGCGERTMVDFVIAPRQVNLLDWRRMRD